MNLTPVRAYALSLRFILIGITILPLNVNTNAQGWRGIMPIRSMCKEVERELGGAACGKKSVTYEFPDENVTFVFSDEGCNGKWPHQPYNVPTGTVVGISVIRKGSKRLTIADLKIDLSKFEKTEIDDMVGAFKYISREVGMYITASEEGQVSDYAYVPAASYDNLRCPPSTEPNPLDKLLKVLGQPSIKVGSYNPASRDQESQLFCKLIEKLEEFASGKGEAKDSVAIVHVIAYAKQGTHGDEAKKIAEQSRNRLVSNYKFNAGKVIAWDGGYRQNTTVELFIQPNGANAPEANPTLTPRPNEQK